MCARGVETRCSFCVEEAAETELCWALGEAEGVADERGDLFGCHCDENEMLSFEI